ncbi:MAG: hypothetical protein WCD38_11150 [Candidatus Tumulicola sp.]
MMTQQLQAGIVSAPVAQIDRRALSQAWFSALHLARAQSVQTRPPRAQVPAAPPTGRSLFLTPERAPLQRSPRGALRLLHGAAKRFDAAVSIDARSAAARSLARRIARAVSSPRTLPMRSTLSLGPGEGRVHVILQNGNGRLRLIAICRPADRDVVARAVAQVRLALAMRGWELEAKTGAFVCS